MKIALISSLLGFLSLTAPQTALAVKVGDKFPSSIELHHNFPPDKINIADRIANKNTIIVGLPGAFTPTWSTRQVPGYLEHQDALKAAGVDEVIIYCVNDGAVMMAWAEDHGVTDESMVTLFGDPYGQLTEALDMEMTHAGPKSVGIINRCKRFALYLEDGVVKIVRVAEADDDPAGDDRPDVTLADALVDAIKALNGSDEL
jgi:2-Cys peroxiredoxin 5